MSSLSERIELLETVVRPLQEQPSETPHSVQELGVLRRAIAVEHHAPWSVSGLLP
jgi:hypothetical protein